MLHSLKTYDVSRCHGCGLCAMVCPVYQQGGSVMTTPQGIARALQAGGELQEADVMACVLCGACMPLCPENIDLMQMLVELRSLVKAEGFVDIQHDQYASQSGKTVFIADAVLAEDESRLLAVVQRLGCNVVLAVDQGADIGRAMRQGQEVAHARLHQFLTTLQSVKKIIISDGLLQQLVKSKLPQIAMQSLGQLLSSRTEVKQQLSSDDCYVMDSQSYHTDYATSVQHYDRLQRSTGCQLTRDLHRMAIPTGVHVIEGDTIFDSQRQVEWLMRGRDVQRLVVESFADQQCLSEYCDQTVIHITELAQ